MRVAWAGSGGRHIRTRPAVPHASTIVARRRRPRIRQNMIVAGSDVIVDRIHQVLPPEVPAVAPSASDPPSDRPQFLQYWPRRPTSAMLKSCLIPFELAVTAR